jgi:putative flippase GtrA
MKLFTDRLRGTSRTVTRFVIVGNSGALIQYLIYIAFLYLFRSQHLEGEGWVSLAFTAGYVLEMVYNYLMQAYYVFESTPKWKNITGFLLARLVNYVLQMVLLWLFVAVMSEQWAGILSIVVAGVVNYFVMSIFFTK